MLSGCWSFYREIDLCGSGDVVSALVARGWPAEGEDGGITRLGNLAVISARPRGFAEHSSYSKFAALQKKGILHCTPTLLPGSLIGGKEFLLRDRLEPLADNKFSNFKEYVTLYPEFDYVFVGDNGQADVRAVVMMMQLAYIKFRAAFIHVVQPIDQTYGLPPDLSKFCFFTNYVQAAIYAYEHKIISAASLARVVIDTVDRFEVVKHIKLGDDLVANNTGSTSGSASHVGATTSSNNSNGDLSPKAESVFSVNTDVATPVPKTERDKTEKLRLEINEDVGTALSILKLDLMIGEQELGWSHEMVSTVRDLILEIRPIDAPRYLSQNQRVATKYAQGEVEGFSPDIGFYGIKVSGKGGKSLKSGARVFSYYTQVKEDDQASSKWPRLPTLGIFSRRMSHSDFGSPSGRESPRSSAGRTTSA